MPDSGISDGSTFTSAFWDDYVREQVVCTCTSATRPTAVEGRCIYETDTNRLLMHDGSGWVILAEPTQSWTPTFTGITGGSPTTSGTYRRSDGWCDFAATLTLGGTPSVFSPGLTLPFTASTVVRGQFTVAIHDSGTSYSPGWHGDATSPYDLFAMSASGTYVGGAYMSTTVPHTWASGDQIFVTGRFQMSTRYT